MQNKLIRVASVSGVWARRLGVVTHEEWTLPWEKAF